MPSELPKMQTAAVKQGCGPSSTVPLSQVPVPAPGAGQILVKINWSGVCWRDKSFIYDEFTTIGMVMQESAQGITGHEGAGVVVAVHPTATHRWKIGDRAGVKLVVSTCGECEFCTNGKDELHCPSQARSGMTVPGTFQEYVVTDARYATRLPDGVSDEVAGPIMCGGVTAYVATKRCGVRAGQWLVILGAGGRVGHLGVQYARAAGARIIAIDDGPENDKMCKALGAEYYLDFTRVQNLEEMVNRFTTYGAHGVIDFAASKASYAIAPRLLRPSGTMVPVGLPADPTAVAGGLPVMIAMRQLRVVAGSVTGTLKEVDEALDFAARGIVKPILVRAKLGDLEDILARMRDGKLSATAVLKVGA